MTHDDPVLARIAALPNPLPDAARSRKIERAALPLLKPRPLHPAWALLVFGSTCGYLGSALYFTLRLF
jgi:hypothetical protein